jgi:type 1 fimbria pilin
MKNRNRLIMGTAIGLAVIAVAIDHTKHRVPAAEANSDSVNIVIEGDNGSSPCSMTTTTDDSGSSPCSL